MIDIHAAFGFLIITFECMGGLVEKWFHSVIRTRVDLFQPLFSKIRKIIKWPMVVNAPVGPSQLINSTAGITNPIATTNPIKE